MLLINLDEKGLFQTEINHVVFSATMIINGSSKIFIFTGYKIKWIN